MRLLIPVHALNVRLEYLNPSFFFLKHGLEQAIITALEDVGQSLCIEFQDREDNYCAFILAELEKHFMEMEESNSLPSNWKSIYNSVKIATTIVKEEVSCEIQNLLGDKPMRILNVRRLSKYDCLISIVYN